jgi:hypothetical protein
VTLGSTIVGQDGRGVSRQVQQGVRMEELAMRGVDLGDRCRYGLGRHPSLGPADLGRGENPGHSGCGPGLRPRGLGTRPKGTRHPMAPISWRRTLGSPETTAGGIGPSIAAYSSTGAGTRGGRPLEQLGDEEALHAHIRQGKSKRLARWASCTTILRLTKVAERPAAGRSPVFPSRFEYEHLQASP